MRRAVRGVPESRVRAGGDAVLHRFAAWQTPFSVVSGLMPGVLVLVFATDLIVGHEGANRTQILWWIVLFGIATTLPFALGRRYPAWLGLVMVAFYAGWITYFIVWVNHVHAHISALLELPMVALYLGWFFRPGIGRPFMFVCVVAVIVAVSLNPEVAGPGIPSWITTGYAIMIAGLGFEGGVFIRRVADARLERDELTGALNRRGLDRLARLTASRAARRDVQLTCVVIDFDHFKEINDSAGHAAGDTALRDTVLHWMSHMNRSDLIARTGGDEFVIILHCCTEDGRMLVEEVQRSSPHPWSYGISAFPSGDTLDRAIARADEHLYRARGNRRRNA
ncbi:hypothetical protein GCM10009847_20800 [Leucobacter tardus]|uniref:GGDEF domain-containing protein n=1 Tax=Leucobacter tardus TaxID=501483 RepID=A0A939QEI5_9MICO|nr:GGDEF domain-containing protein [Leucobacter tardus]MBO2990406.1 GGDEF domain-containing protein [Leucobacter tardus]